MAPTVTAALLLLLLPATVAQRTVVDTAIGDGRFTTLVAALQRASLVTALNGTGPFTVFAPTDAAFTALLTARGLTAQQLLNRTDLASILQYHVLSGQVLSSQLQASQDVATLQGLKVTVTKTGAAVRVGPSANVTTADITCTNGVIHVIDAVLMPPSVVDTAVNNPQFSTLVAALTQANLVSVLSAPGPFTVFAPTNAAFTAFLTARGLTAQQLLNRADLASILQYHVLSGQVLSSQLQASQDVATLQGLRVTVTKVGAAVKVGPANVTTADITCTNGVIHVIDTVLTPPSVVDTAVNNPQFSTLVTALTRANLVSALSAPGPFTVFAPTNAAFAAFLTARNLTAAALLNRTDLAGILQFHVLSGRFLSSQLQASQDVTTLQGSKVTVTKSGAAVKVGPATVLAADINCTNGVIHSIDSVLLPPTPSTPTASGSVGRGSLLPSLAVAVAVVVAAMPAGAALAA